MRPKAKKANYLKGCVVSARNYQSHQHRNLRRLRFGLYQNKAREIERMTLTRAYFGCSIGIGLIWFSYLFQALQHSGAEANNYIFAGLAILWVPLSLVAVVGFRKRLLYCISPVAYLTYFVLNYFLSPKNSFHAELDAAGVASTVFGALYALLNAWLLYAEMRV